MRAGSGVTPADAEEVRSALALVQSAGKPVIAHIQSFVDGDLSAYLAVSGADEVWIHPGGWFAATGLRSERLFFGDALTRFGAEGQFLQLYEYKGAADIFTRSGFSDAGREAAQAWIDSLYATAIASIAEDQGLAPDVIEQRLRSGPFLAAAAVENGLVDRLGHAEDARRRTLSRFAPAKLTPLAAYARGRPRADEGPVIALIT